MKNLKLTMIVSIVSLSLVGCAGAARWKHAGVSPEKRTWRNCSTVYDGPAKADKGICYIDREWKWVVWGIKKKYRAKNLYCAWGDMNCIRDNQVKKIIIK